MLGRRNPHPWQRRGEAETVTIIHPLYSTSESKLSEGLYRLRYGPLPAKVFLKSATRYRVCHGVFQLRLKT